MAAFFTSHPSKMIAMKIQWEGRLIYLNGGLRKHILFWSIPKHLRGLHDLRDGMTVNISLDIDGHISSFPARLFGGCEFKVPEHLQSPLIAHQRRHGSVKFQLLDFTDPNSEAFQSQIRRLSSLSNREMMKKLPPRGNIPEKVSLISTAFVRSRLLVAYALRRSGGCCEACGKTPFRRFNGGEVYLEVHHIIPLASDGPDSEENVMALCPECHRFAHFGNPKEWSQILTIFFAKTKLPDPRRELRPTT